MPDGGVPVGWEAAEGQWWVAGGRLQARPAPSSGQATLLWGEHGLRDLGIEIELAAGPQPKTGPGSKPPVPWCGLIVRDGGRLSPGLELSARLAGSRTDLELLIARPAPEKGRHVLLTATVHHPSQGVHRLGLEARGGWIRGYWDGEQVLASPRGDEGAPAGRTGIRAGGGPVLIQSVSITRPTGELPTTQPAARARPLVIAHRGFSWVAPENTLASYRRALQTSADMAECDVYLTSDRVPVLLHDRTLQRTTGLAAQPGERTLAQIKLLDAGRWKSPEFTGEPVPTLLEALALLKGRLRLVIELKEQGTEQEVLAAIKASGTPPEELMIFSFEREAIEAISRLEPLLPTTWLIGDLPYAQAERGEVLRQALRARVSGLGLPLERVDPEFLRRAHGCGLAVFVWTVDEPVDMRFLIRIGVDAIITDRPDVLCELLSKPLP